jgi:ATP-dependent protease ClpP protease subunit
VKDKELYLYSPIYSGVAENLLAQMEENADNDITLRMNTPGGSVLAGNGLCIKMKERNGKAKTTIKVDGAAMSMGCYMLVYADNVECSSVSKFMLHPADMYVSDETDQAFLDSMNKDLRAQLEAKIDSKKMKALTGYSIADMFEDEKTPDIHFGADVAEKIGLVNKVNKLTPAEATAMAETMKYFAIAATAVEDKTKNPVMTEIKTLNELKTAYPVLYKEAVQKGKDKEYARVIAINAFRKVDPKACAKMIKKRKEVTEEFKAEMTLKANSPEAIAALAKESARAIDTPVADAEKAKAEAKTKEVIDFEKGVDKYLAESTGKKYVAKA